jgi:hypothetical protein
MEFMTYAFDGVDPQRQFCRRTPDFSGSNYSTLFSRVP